MGLATFHFLRPWWLLLIALAVLVFMVKASSRSKHSPWEKVIDPHLLNYLLPSASMRVGSSKFKSLLMPLFIGLCAIALAGPTYEKIPNDVGFSKTPLIIALEVSDHMSSEDLSPSRLKRALFKLEDLLAAYKGGEVALIAFAGDAHLVVPMSEDPKTILELAKGLNVDLMPKHGVDLDAPLRLANSMLNRYPGAKLLLMTSTNFDQSDDVMSEVLKRNKMPLLLWTFATKTGAPIKNSDGQFRQNQQNAGLALSQLRSETVEQAGSMGARHIAFSADSRDIQAILDAIDDDSSVLSKRDYPFDTWFDLGPYVLILATILLVFSLVFAREYVIFFSLIIMLPSTKLQAEGIFTDWFLRKDQRAQRALELKDYEKAASLFDDDLRKGSAFYKAKLYDKAVEHLKKVDTSDGKYNLGNAYAQKGQYQEAIQAYTEALQRNPKNADAEANKKLVEKLMPKQEKKGQNQDDQKQQNQDQKKSDGEQQPQSSSEQKSSEKDDKKSQGQEKDSSRDQTEPKNSAKKDEGGEQKAKEEKSDEDGKKAGPQEQREKKPAPASQEKEAIQPTEEKLDKATRYYFDQLEKNNNLYLKRKFFYESHKNQDAR